MLKKCFTGFSLLVFVFTAAVPLLFPTNQVIADANYQYSQPYTAYYYCPDGTLLYTTTGTTTNSTSVDHPPDTEKTIEVCGYDWPYGYPGPKVWVCEDVTIYEHTSHGTTYVYNSNEVTYTRSASEEACR